MNQARASFTSNLIFAINPTLWFSFGLIETSTNTRAGYFKLALFMGIVGFSIFPWGDGYERFRMFSKAEFVGPIEFIANGFLQGDIVFYLIAYIVNHSGLSYQFVQFFFVFIGYSVLFSSLRFLLRDVRQKDRLILIVIVLLLINFIGLANNLRYMLATIFSLHAIFLKEEKNNSKLFYLYFVLAGLTHFYAFFLLSIYVVIFRVSRNISDRNVKLILLFSFLLAFVSPSIINVIATFISQGDGLIARKFASYLLGSDGLITKMVSSPAQFINHTIKQLPLVILVCYFLMNKNLRCNKTRFFILFFSFSLVFIYFFSVYLRLSYFCLLYGLWLLISKWNNQTVRPKWIYTMLIVSFLYCTLNIVYFQRIIERDNISLINGNTLCTIANPIFLIDKCSYGDMEIFKGNTEFILLKRESLNRTMEVIGK